MRSPVDRRRDPSGEPEEINPCGETRAPALPSPHTRGETRAKALTLAAPLNQERRLRKPARAPSLGSEIEQSISRDAAPLRNQRGRVVFLDHNHNRNRNPNRASPDDYDYDHDRVPPPAAAILENS